mmetsp:Transcript_21713/g.53581  ORF Transcript_21713/g.53581 Transcript_21713/m.53581 type:complete len:268 (+) Transcript_21713:284-1087(+)
MKALTQGAHRDVNLVRILPQIREVAAHDFLQLVHRVRQQRIKGHRRRQRRLRGVLMRAVPERKPLWRGKIDGLGDIESRVEAGVVRPRGGNHKLPRVVAHSPDRDAVLEQGGRREHGGLEGEDAVGGLVRCSVDAAHDLLELGGVGLGNDVPDFAVAGMEVRDGDELRVFDVPAKAGVQASDVEHAFADAGQAGHEVQQRLLRAPQIARVPHRRVRVAAGPRLEPPVPALLLRVFHLQVDAVLNHERVGAGLLHNAPKLALHPRRGG